MSSSIDSSKPFRFLALPAELRDEIYGLVLASHNQDDPCALPWNYFISPNITTPDGLPALLGTSKQVRSEAGPIFFGCRSFSIYSIIVGSLLASALKMLQPQHNSCLKWMQELEIRFRWSPKNARCQCAELIHGRICYTDGVVGGYLAAYKGAVKCAAGAECEYRKAKAQVELCYEAVYGTVKTTNAAATKVHIEEVQCSFPEAEISMRGRLGGNFG